MRKGRQRTRHHHLNVSKQKVASLLEKRALPHLNQCDCTTTVRFIKATIDDILVVCLSS